MRLVTSRGARTIGIALLLLVSPHVAAADPVDDIVTAELKRQGVPGASVAIVRDGKIVKTEGYGLANAELNVRATSQAVYQIGSVSKQFIAAGIMLLVQDGKMSLDDKASKYLAPTPAAWQAITVRHLLTHTAGIVNEPPAFDRPHRCVPITDEDFANSVPIPVPQTAWIDICRYGIPHIPIQIPIAAGKPNRVFAEPAAGRWVVPAVVVVL